MQNFLEGVPFVQLQLIAIFQLFFSDFKILRNRLTLLLTSHFQRFLDFGFAKLENFGYFPRRKYDITSNRGICTELLLRVLGAPGGCERESTTNACQTQDFDNAEWTHLDTEHLQNRPNRAYRDPVFGVSLLSIPLCNTGVCVSLCVELERQLPELLDDAQ